MSIARATTLLAQGEAAESAGHHINPYLIGGVTLVILLGMLIALLLFAGGREHS